MKYAGLKILPRIVHGGGRFMAACTQAAGLADTGEGGCPMRIEQRDWTLTYTRAIRDDKRRLVLNWLLEFQFSSVELLARRRRHSSASNPTGTSRKPILLRGGAILYEGHGFTRGTVRDST